MIAIYLRTVDREFAIREKTKSTDFEGTPALIVSSRLRNALTMNV